MKKLLLIKMFLITSLISYGQDIIYMHNGQQLKCKIISVNAEQVNYQRSTSESEFSLDLSDIRKLKYEDGSIFYVKGASNGITYEVWEEEKILDLNAKNLKRKNGFFSPKYFINDNRVSKGEIEEVLYDSGPFLQEFRKGHKGIITSNVLGNISGFIFGFTIGTYIGSGFDSESIYRRTMFFSGLTYISSIIALSNSRKRINQVFDFHNTEQNSLGLGVTPNGIGLCLRF